MENLIFIENKSVSAKQISDLRENIGWNRMENAFSDKNMQSYFHVACYDKQVLVGYIDCVSNMVTDAYIQDLMVAKEYQKRGIGTELVNKVISRTRKDGIYMVNVLFDEHLTRFYKKFGFNCVCGGQIQNFISF
ncbi:MAG: GNAT family N-acetyltransferase [Clostridiales bacterium]|mgnify:CR=1 FL=1|nr:GNAT family N-acetyltransferase [Clostridiales bacterium]